jgi:holo-[acyl-carrier protein] synthase
MIIGVGSDVVQINRIEKILIKYGDIFKKKILNKSELLVLKTLNSSKHASFLAKRFAAKESISKALGTGLSNGITFKDIVILNDDFGRPFAQINEKKLKEINLDKTIKINISLSDDYPIALAFAVISI